MGSLRVKVLVQTETPCKNTPHGLNKGKSKADKGLVESGFAYVE